MFKVYMIGMATGTEAMSSTAAIGNSTASSKPITAAYTKTKSSDVTTIMPSRRATLTVTSSMCSFGFARSSKLIVLPK